MGRKIILLSDGTGNSAAKVWRTNVWRVFESIDLSGSGQVAFYDDGVGTSSFKPLAILGGAFGYGLKRNVLDLYKFACRNFHNKDDEIFGFGFSRGAFTMRVVVGLIMEQGIIQEQSEKELDRKARAAYRDFRRRNFHTIFRTERFFRWLRDLFIRSDYSKDNNFHNATVRFIGLWDTVAAYGMPIEEMTRGVSDYIFPLLLPSFELDPRVKRACHALSIDDERTTFHPVLWDERAEPSLVPRADGSLHLADERISQVWFAGVHSNVGGGYPDDSLAYIPLVWIMNEAVNAGLTFKTAAIASPQTLSHAPTVEDKDGRQYDPRSGLGGYYRYGPRDIHELGKELLARRGGHAVPKIHVSVLKRITNNAHVYAPNGVPADYQVVTDLGEVLPPPQNPYEAPAQAQARANRQEGAWNFVWQRRIVYFLSVGVSFYLAVFPLMKAAPPAAEFESRVRWISDGIRMAGNALPNAAETWINGYARQPFRFAAVVVVLAVLLWWGSRLAGHIQNEMRALWAASLAAKLHAAGLPDDLVYKLRTSKWYRFLHRSLKQNVAPALFALGFAYCALAVLSHALFVVQDDFGLVCRETERPLTMKPGDTIKLQRSFNAANPCQDMGIVFEEHKTYKVVIEINEPFRKSGIDADASRGFYLFDAPTLMQKVGLFVALPLRRELIRPWFRIVARLGGTGGEETFLDPDSAASISPVPIPNSAFRKIRYEENIKATKDGRLFLFVNDAVLAIPGYYGIFYGENQGTADVTITQEKSCFVCP
jgi:uncharacterized protein (DUF2235 family)